ncbi:WD repeat-containing protein 1-like [Dysidea avara]|uniref:WD repeat-containing protein 1-like n=1 Tax=Dysidea avara TaxID=196820 RepID=UPI00331C8265
MSCTKRSIFATLPRTQRGIPLVIKGDPKGKNILYCNGNSVVIRDIANPGISDVYTQHSVPASVATYAPSGFYIASGDNSGKIRIWDTTQAEHILKYEYQPIAGVIKDIVWSPDSKRIAVCGEGREKYGHVFLWDSGSSVGEIIGHSKPINSIDYRPTRPFRVATGGEDRIACWFEGPPFRYKNAFHDHERFVNVVRFSPDGERLLTGGADGKVFIYNGKDGEKLGSLGGDANAHSGGIYALSWGPDSEHVLTASGDKTCKLWDVQTSQVVTEFKMGNTVEDQQVSCLWQGEYLLSVSLTGNINYLDRNNPDKPLRVLTGHNKNITALSSYNKGTTLYSASFDGRVVHWNSENGDMDVVSGRPHTYEVCRIAPGSNKLYTIAQDKLFRNILPDSQEFGPESVLLDGLDPKDAAVASDGTAVVATNSMLVLIRDNKRVSDLAVSYDPVSADMHPTKPEVAIGSKDSKVYIYTIDGNELTLKQTLDYYSGEVSAVSYSPGGDYLAVSGGGRKLYIYETGSYKLNQDTLVHLARVTSVAWSPDSSMVATGGVDTNLVVAKLGDLDNKKVMVKGAHPLAPIDSVTWLSNEVLASGASDCCIRLWDVKL